MRTDYFLVCAFVRVPTCQSAYVASRTLYRLYSARSTVTYAVNKSMYPWRCDSFPPAWPGAARLIKPASLYVLRQSNRSNIALHSARVSVTHRLALQSDHFAVSGCVVGSAEHLAPARSLGPLHSVATYVDCTETILLPQKVDLR